MIMRSHPCDPQHVAAVLDEDLPAAEALADMKEHPDLYYPDHVWFSEAHKTLPLSEQAWRRACLAS
jgi:hypothetical protein